MNAAIALNPVEFVADISSSWLLYQWSGPVSSSVRGSFMFAKSSSTTYCGGIPA